jgi:putative acetyltransferase
MTLDVKRLSRDEMDRAALILRTAFDNRLPWLTGRHTPEEDRAFFRDHVLSTCDVWGATDGDIIGFIAFREDWIDHLYVLPDSQGRGAGRALLLVAMSAWSCLNLWTFQRNFAARAFYEKNGFIATRETDGSGNQEREPDVLYRWQKST